MKKDATPNGTFFYMKTFLSVFICGRTKEFYFALCVGRYPLTSRRFPASDARILCSFHLALSDNGTPALTKTALPKQLPSFTVDYEPYDLRLLVLGQFLQMCVVGHQNYASR